MEEIYRASIYVNGVSVFYGVGTNLKSLIAQFTTLLTGENSQTVLGIENKKGDVVYQSRKVAEE